MKIKSFTWFQILNPFNFSALKSVYDGISTENRTSFWNITVSFVVAILTAWLGFTISNNIQTSNENLNSRILRYQLVDKFGPICDDYSLHTLSFKHNMIAMFGEKLTPNKMNLSKEDALKFNKFISDTNNRRKLIQMGDSTINIIRKIMPYVSDKYRKKMETNNFLVLCGCFTLKKLDSPRSDSRTFVTELRNYINMPQNARVIGLNSSLNEVLNKGANLYNMILNTKNDNELNSLSITTLIIQMIIIPTIENEIFINNDIYGEVSSENPILDSAFILLWAFLISYMLYRILILKVFIGRVNLCSSDDFEKVKRQSRDLEYETRLLRLEVSELKRKLKDNGSNI